MTINNSDFSPEKYWQQRVSGKIDLKVVGRRSFGRAYNRYIYQRRLDLLLDVIKDLNMDMSRLKVLDIGCGSGFYIDLWKSMGVTKYVGVDISKESVTQLRARYPEYEFIQADITYPETLYKLKNTYDMITVFDVMYHIIDDNRAATAFNIMNKLLCKDGTIFVFDQLLDKDSSLTSHVKFRARESYMKLLYKAGLMINSRRQLFLLLEPPIFGIKYLDILIAGGYKSFGFVTKYWEGFGKLLGYSLYHLDNFFLKRGMSIPNQELLIIKKK